MLSPALLAPTLVEHLKGGDDHDLFQALSQLAQIVETCFGEDADALCEFLRVSGCVTHIGRAVGHSKPSIQQCALLLVGNIGSDSVDALAEKTRAILKRDQAFEAIVPYVFAEDSLTLAYALGAVQNLCVGENALEYVELMQQMGAVERLQELLHCNDAQLEQYAKGILINMRQTIISHATLQQMNAATEKSACVHIQSSVRRMLAKRTTRTMPCPVVTRDVEQAHALLTGDQRLVESIVNIGTELKSSGNEHEPVDSNDSIGAELESSGNDDGKNGGASSGVSARWRQLQVVEVAMAKAQARAHLAEERAHKAEERAQSILAAAAVEKEAMKERTRQAMATSAAEAMARAEEAERKAEERAREAEERAREAEERAQSILAAAAVEKEAIEERTRQAEAASAAETKARGEEAEKRAEARALEAEKRAAAAAASIAAERRASAIEASKAAAALAAKDEAVAKLAAELAASTAAAAEQAQRAAAQEAKARAIAAKAATEAAEEEARARTEEEAAKLRESEKLMEAKAARAQAETTLRLAEAAQRKVAENEAVAEAAPSAEVSKK